MKHMVKHIKHTSTTSKIFKLIMLFMLIILLFTPSDLLAQPDWQVQLKIKAGNAHNFLILGAADDATDGFDNTWETQALFGGGIRAYFPREEWNETHIEYWRDIKANDPGVSKSWPFTVDIDDQTLVDQTFTITWKMFKIPEGFTLTLTDIVTGEQIDMRATSSYAFIYTAPRSFSVDVVNPGCGNSAVRIAGAVPAPFAAIQEAYNIASDSALIQSQRSAMSGNLNFNLNKSVAIKGGFDCGYASVAGATTVNGNISVSQGTITLANIILQ